MATNSYVNPLWTAAGRKAIEYIDSDIIVLGAGRTILATADALADSGLYKGRLIVPATEGTRKYIEGIRDRRGLKIEIGGQEDLDPGYTYFDGADEIVATRMFGSKAYRPGLRAEHDKMLIKGGDKGTGDPGKEGCMKKEWTFAYGAGKFIVVADHTKAVPYLGVNFGIPVEFNPDMDKWVLEYTQDCMKTKDVRRRTYNGRPFVTENGKHIYDVKFDSRNFRDLAKLSEKLKSHIGIVSTGLFADAGVVPDFAIIAPEKGDPFVYE
jgi:ribose 5-phosphate isomerase